MASFFNRKNVISTRAQRSFSANPASGTTVPRYKYSPLPSPQSIRLIELHPGLTQEWSGISLSLKVTSLQEAPAYDALCYTWGYPLTPFSPIGGSDSDTDSVRRHPINVDGQRLEVTANLIDALCALADTKIQRSVRRSHYLWADGICINQEDDLERAAQVSIMGSIYELAQSVVIWLGREDEFTDDAMAAITALSKLPKHLHSEVKCRDWYAQEAVLRKLGLRKEIKPHMWLGLVAFLNRPWFKRAWIVQEVANAKHAVVVCGNKTLPWVMLADTISFLTSSQWHEHISTDRMRVYDIIPKSNAYRKLLEANVEVGLAAIYLESTRSGIARSGHKGLFRYLVQAHRVCQASDPRDMIYAFLGIAWMERPPFSMHPTAIVPDYKISVLELYANVAKTMLQSYKDLRFLSQVQDRSCNVIDNLPSWVPDYSVDLKPTPLSMRGVPSWKASGDLSWNYELGCEQAGMLNVSGYRLDPITTTITVELDAHDFAETSATDDYWINVFGLTCGLKATYPVGR